MSTAEFKDLKFIHEEGWQQNNPQNILLSVKSVCEEIKNNMKVIGMLLMPLTFCQIPRGSRTLEQVWFLFLEFNNKIEATEWLWNWDYRYFFSPPNKFFINRIHQIRPWFLWAVPFGVKSKNTTLGLLRPMKHIYSWIKVQFWGIKYSKGNTLINIWNITFIVLHEETQALQNYRSFEICIKH